MTGESDAYILSLKNLYQLLTKDDYPSPSRAVIRKSMRKGVTLLGFWRGILSGDLAITPVGKRLWAEDDERPRYLSDIFNRTRPYAFYPDYFKAAAGAVNPAMLLNITDRMARFLLSSEYSSALLHTRLLVFSKLIRHHDVDVTPAIQSFLTNLLWQKPEFEGEPDKLVFFDAYCLSVLSLHAFFGSQMNNEGLTSLRTDSAFQLPALFSVYQKRNRGTGFPQPICLTGRMCELCREPLEDGLFFGRQEEKNKLKAQIIRGGKMIISGIGGIGKTELLRQVLKDILSEGVFSRVAYVQYQDNLHESFIRSFTDPHGQSKLMKYQECADQLNILAGGRTLLLVDGMNTPRSEDETLMDLSGLNCDIVLTSRLTGLMDFRVISLSAPDYPAALSIFTAHYGQEAEGSAALELDAIINMKLNRHPLMCGIIGKMARAKHITIPDLHEALELNGLQGSYTRETELVRVEDILTSLFGLSRLDVQKQRLLRLFSLLPLRLYSFQTCQELLRDISRDPDTLSNELESLCYSGWLQSSASSYSMHPVIAEAILKNKPSVEEFPRLLALLSVKIDMNKFREWDYVHIAYFVLKNNANHSLQSLRVLMDTAYMLVERSITDAARQLADIGMRVAESSGSRAFLLDCHALHLNLLRNAGTFENAPYHVNEVLRLFPDARDCPNRAAAAGLALYFAWSLAMNEQKDALYAMLSEGPWEGNDYVTQCAHMSMIQEFTTDYPEGIAWADKGLRYVSEQGNPNCLDAATLYKAKALFCALCGRTEEAEDSIANYKRIIRDWYDGVDFIELAQINQYLGIAFYQTGEYEKSLPYSYDSLNAFRKTYPGDAVIIEHTLNNIGNTYYRMKRYPEAIRYNKEAFDMHRRLHKVPNLQLAALMNNLGCVLRDSGKAEAALELFEEALEIASPLADRDHICIAEISMNLGLLYLQGGDPLRAKPFFETAIPVFDKNYGPEHMKTRLAKSKLESVQSVQTPQSSV